jgi:site-specific DNA-methyltransferase (adenine-specific)
LNTNNLFYRALNGDCLEYLSTNPASINNVHLTFFDPPYRQGKEYRFFDDNQPEDKYWAWIKQILSRVYDVTVTGGAVYFMHREKNIEWMMSSLRETGWNFQNIILWKKFTSAVPCEYRFGKVYQPIIFATKGAKPRVFNKLRIDYPIRPGHKYIRPDGVFVTDVWDDIRELTSGYFAGEEALRDGKGKRIHIQQSPIALLLRIILSSSLPGDLVLDPVAGSGTTLVVAYQLERNSIGIEIDPEYIEVINKRLESHRSADNLLKYIDYYRFTRGLEKIYPTNIAMHTPKRLL